MQGDYLRPRSVVRVATGIAWVVALVVAFLTWRWSMYRAYARHVMASPEYEENARRAEEFFGGKR